MSQGERAALQARYRELLEHVRGLGFAVPGSVIERYTGCAAPGCHCHDDPPVKHGPYLQYTRKLAGKTTSRRLDPEQVERYREWIADRLRLDDLLDQMDQRSDHHDVRVRDERREEVRDRLRERVGSADGRPSLQRQGAGAGVGIDQVSLEGKKDGSEHPGLVPVAAADLIEGAKSAR